jgi:hypothetical protein
VFNQYLKILKLMLIPAEPENPEINSLLQSLDAIYSL